MDEILELGSRRELFVDEYVVDRLGGGAQRLLHQPTPREISLLADRPWEGNMSGAYGTVFQDGSLYRLYYQAWHVEWDQAKMHEPRGLSAA
ncbi:hypothetical protein HQ590_14685 [bacterium]|nr:hypothetical protein [bacterium]